MPKPGQQSLNGMLREDENMFLVMPRFGGDDESAGIIPGREKFLTL